MKATQKIFMSMVLLLGWAVGFSACAGEDKNKEEETAVATVMEVDQLLTEADALIDQAVVVQGVCTHVCSHGGGKLFLMGSDDTKMIRVDAGEAIGSFPQEVVNALVKIEGRLVEERIDEAYLVKWEADIAAETPETAEQSGEAPCTADTKASGVTPANDVAECIANYRARIAERNELEGKPYVSLYHIVADKYEIL